MDEQDGPTLITVVIPTIEGREKELKRALDSVHAQTFCVDRRMVMHDVDRRGAAWNRNRALQQVDTEWVAFLDDDDEFKPDHLKVCARYAALTGVDVVYPGYEAVGDDPINCFGLAFDPVLLKRRNYIPVTVLARTDAVRAAGGFQEHPDENGDPCEDWGLWLAMLERGYTFGHVPQRTWVWHINGGARAL